MFQVVQPRKHSKILQELSALSQVAEYMSYRGNILARGRMLEARPSAHSHRAQARVQRRVYLQALGVEQL